MRVAFRVCWRQCEHDVDVGRRIREVKDKVDVILAGLVGEMCRIEGFQSRGYFSIFKSWH
jgi:hypothetical protein